MNNAVITADQIEDGIYFDLDEDVYHAVERVSGTGIKNVMVSPAYYWSQSHLNPVPEQLTPEQESKRSLARVLGRAYHAARLEPHVFSRVYVREISQADFAGNKGFLTNQTQIKAELKEADLKQSGSVMECAERLHASGYKGTIWHIEEKDWRDALEADQIPIAGKYYDDIVRDMERIRKNPEIASKLSGGFSEVSIFWTDELGIKCKCRIDYLKPAIFAEFKTYANSMRKHVEQCIMDAIQYERYYISIIFYHQALEAARLSEDLKVHGSAEQCSLIGEIRANPRPLIPWIIFQEKGGIPNIFAREFRMFDLPLDLKAAMSMGGDYIDQGAIDAAIDIRERKTEVHVKAEREIRQAKQTWSQYSAAFERGEEWFPHNMEREISDADFRPHFLEN